MIGVAQDDLRAEVFQMADDSAFTVAWVPTGMKTGVAIVPWLVRSRASRARPQVARISKLSLMAQGSSLVGWGGHGPGLMNMASP